MRAPTFNKHGTFTHDINCQWNEFVQLYSKDRVRKKLINNATEGFKLLKSLGINTVFIGGSFASSKKKPRDIDGVFMLELHFDKYKLPKNFLSILDSYGLDFYPHDMPTLISGESHLDFFRRGHFNENPCLIKLSLKAL